LISRNARFTVVTVLLTGTALFLQDRARNEFVPPRIALASFPVELKNWVGLDLPIPDEILKSHGEFLQRTYKDQTARDADVDLYLAYLPIRSNLVNHLPQDCLVGSGWLPVESGITTLSFPGDAPFPANRYLVARGDEERQLVLFWYSARGRRVASENEMDFYLVLDSLRLNRSDNTLVRMNTELQPGEEPVDAERRLLTFAQLVNPLLKKYIPQ
jgi:EpsI family protein